MTEIICDWLDVTYGPADHPVANVVALLNELGFDLRSSFVEGGSSKDTWSSPDNGVLVIQSNARFVRISASGGVLDYLRIASGFNGYLAVLSACPYRVTRLDAALDLSIDAAPVIQALTVDYPTQVQLTRKSVNTRWLLSARGDGVISGSFYCGDRRSGSGGITARVYDKAKEQFDRCKRVTGPCVRYEITFGRKVGCTLRDAHNPTSLFWHAASPSLLSKPPDQESWHPIDPEDTGWISEMIEIVPYQALKRRVASSPDVGALISLADTLGPHGRTQLLRELQKRIGSDDSVGVVPGRNPLGDSAPGSASADRVPTFPRVAS